MRPSVARSSSKLPVAPGRLFWVMLVLGLFCWSPAWSPIGSPAAAQTGAADGQWRRRGLAIAHPLKGKDPAES